MGFSLEISVPVLTVFFQGLLSFFSPCVLPLIPIYIGYLSGGTGQIGEDGRIHFKRSKVLFHTVFFVLGVSFAFFLLGLGFSAMGNFLKENQIWFARIGGVIVILFGLYQMGFTFSFAWTPCVGPALASVLLMTASAATKVTGFLYIAVYTAGFVLPFLAVGLFTTTLLEFFKNHMKVVHYTVKIGGILMIFMGILMLTGKMNAVTGALSSTETQEEATEAEPEEEEEAAEEVKTIPAIDFTLKDQYGNTHTLSDYKGKTVFLNFWATWCSPCKAEMPDIQKLYEEFQQEDVVILGVAAPNLGKEQSEEGIRTFLEENGYTYPVLMDTEAEAFQAYGINSFPTTFMIDKDGNVFGYIPGQLSEEIMRDIISQTINGERK